MGAPCVLASRPPASASRRAITLSEAPNPKLVALVPARSGSERVLGKNVRPLGGHPLLAYAVATALQAGVFQRVVCSTDSGKIAEVAQRYGADVPFLRPTELATATSPDIEWIAHTLAE